MIRLDLLHYKAIIDRTEDALPRSCADCRHYLKADGGARFSRGSRPVSDSGDRCSRFVDVCGHLSVEVMLYCGAARDVNGPCGPEALGFEAPTFQDRLTDAFGAPVTVVT